MTSIRCSDVISVIIDEATDQFKDKYVLNKNALYSINNIKKNIDKLYKKINATSLDIDINDVTKEISISIGCRDVILENDHTYFYDMLKNAKNFSVNRMDDDSISITFVYASIWEKR